MFLLVPTHAALVFAWIELTVERQLRAPAAPTPRPAPPPRTVRARPAPLVPVSPSARAGFLCLPERGWPPTSQPRASRSGPSPCSPVAAQVRRCEARGATRREAPRGASTLALCARVRGPEPRARAPAAAARAHLSRYSLPHPPPPSPGLASEQFFPTITRAV